MAGEVKVDLGGVSLECEYDQNTLSELMICAFKKQQSYFGSCFQRCCFEVYGAFELHGTECGAKLLSPREESQGLQPYTCFKYVFQ